MNMTIESTLLIGFLVAGFLLLVAGIYIKCILPASREIKYIKTEIDNARTPEARKFWKKELMNVYKSCIFGNLRRKK